MQWLVWKQCRRGHGSDLGYYPQGVILANLLSPLGLSFSYRRERGMGSCPEIPQTGDNRTHDCLEARETNCLDLIAASDLVSPGKKGHFRSTGWTKFW